jgi:dTDP-4-dehydrorhamnose reductase
MKKILVLGHNGMLGNAVCKYFSTKLDDYEISITLKRWGDSAFAEELKNSDADFIINCIGIIPQKKPTVEEYRKINIDLPVFLETLGKKIIHPSTDCEFSGTLVSTEKYTKENTRTAEDDYGKSKAVISKLIEDSYKNTKIIRTSIIGHEENSAVALLDWFLSQNGQAKGYTNHYWNGITTLQWVKLSEQLMNAWEKYPALNQYGTKENRSKYDLLNDIKDVYNKDIEIIPFETEISVNKCLLSDIDIPSINDQLKELKEFYKK